MMSAFMAVYFLPTDKNRPYITLYLCTVVLILLGAEPWEYSVFVVEQRGKQQVLIAQPESCLLPHFDLCIISKCQL